MASSSSSSSSAPLDFWWESIHDECPLTLEPICSFHYPPFSLGKNMYFDGLALASYIVSQGNFQNPLTRQDLTYEECRQLDQHVITYHSNTSSAATKVVSVVEAFGLRNSISVSSSQHDTRRARALRNEATAALCGLFVYQRQQQEQRNGRQDISNTRQQQQQQQSIPRFGFALTATTTHHDDGASRHIQETEGLTIIDDDEGIAVASDRQAWNELEEAFPKLSTKVGDAQVERDDKFMELVKATAEKLKRDEGERRFRIAHHQKLHKEEILKKRLEQKLAREQVKHQHVEKKRVQAEREEQMKLARLEMAKWRDEQWNTMLAMSEAKRQRDEQEKREATERQRQDAERRLEAERAQKELLKQQTQAVADATANEKRKVAAATKRKRARERKRIEKAQAQQEQAKQQRASEVEQKKKASKLKCKHCGVGILDSGFEKNGQRFCTTKCARSLDL